MLPSVSGGIGRGAIMNALGWENEPVIESGDTITISQLNNFISGTGTYVAFYDGSAIDVISGHMAGYGLDSVRFTFSDDTTITIDFTYTTTNTGDDTGDARQTIIPFPALNDVKKIEGRKAALTSNEVGAVILYKARS